MYLKNIYTSVHFVLKGKAHYMNGLAKSGDIKLIQNIQIIVLIV